MTPAELATVVNRLTSTWPTGPRGHVWSEQLSALDYEHAVATYQALTVTEDRAPSVARFLEHYRARTRRFAEPPRHEPSGPPISLAEHVAFLEWKAGTTGDADAVDELERWRRIRARRTDEALERHPSSSTTP